MTLRYLPFSLLLIALLSIASESAVSKQMKDFRVFRDVLLEKEGTLDLHHDESVIRKALSFAEKNFQQEKTLLEQFKIYSLTLSVLECGHTQIHPTTAVLREWLKERKALPLDYYLVGRKLYVSEILPQDRAEMEKAPAGRMQTDLPPEGAEILEIDGHTVGEMMQEMGLFLSSDENGIGFKYYQARTMFEFYRHLALPLKEDSVEIRYTYKEDTNYLKLCLGPAPVYAINARIKKASLDFLTAEKDPGQFDIRDGIGYFRFTSFLNSGGRRYEAFLAESFQKLYDEEIDQLVIDLRGNTGGVMQYSIMRYFVGSDVHLGTYVIEKPKQGIENQHIKKMRSDYRRHALASSIQKIKVRRDTFNNGEEITEEVDSTLVYHGSIVLITDEGTFSAASILAGHLKHFCRAKIIGRPAGGSFYKGNAGSIMLVLPTSRFSVFVNPCTFRSSLPNASDPFKIKQPDVWVEAPYENLNEEDEYFFQAAKKSFE